MNEGTSFRGKDIIILQWSSVSKSPDKAAFMEEGRQKSKRLSYMTKFKREIIQCAEEKGNYKAAAVFGVDESR
jgi:hypothetical protein